MKSTKIAAAAMALGVIGACSSTTTQPSGDGTSSSSSSSGASSSSSSAASSSGSSAASSGASSAASSSGSSAASSSGSGSGGGDDGSAPADDGSQADAPGTGQADASTDGQAETSTFAGDIDELYEAEGTSFTSMEAKSNVVPPNQVFLFAQAASCANKCSTPLTVGDNCCSAAPNFLPGQVTWIVSANGAHTSGWMQFNAVAAPANASYDVTFWYHCGNSDTYGDTDCGGQAFTQPKQIGCRPHVFTVNGTIMPGGYHFPCFPGSWETLYAATVSMTLQAGKDNTILVAPPDPRDSVDVDAIEILPSGKGHAPLIAADTKDPQGH